MRLRSGEALALARESCRECDGCGVPRPNEICGCVYRAIFRACHDRFRYCNEHFVGGRVSLDTSFATHRRSLYGMKAAEYASDFCLIAKRVLTAAQYKLFNLRHLMGADWRVCAHRLNLSKDPLHHEIYSIEQRLGRAYCECQPHALFPVDDYFCYTPSVARQTPVSS